MAGINPNSNVKDGSNAEFTIDQSNKLDFILKEDEHLWRRMYSLSNNNPSAALVDKVYARLQADRKMDKPASTYKSNKDAGIPSGTKVYFKQYYGSIVIPDLEEPLGTIDIAGNKVNCDVEVVKALKAIIKTGITPNEELAMGAREVVLSVLKYANSGFILKGTLVEVSRRLIDSNADYYVKQLAEAIIELYETESEKED